MLKASLPLVQLLRCARVVVAAVVSARFCKALRVQAIGLSMDVLTAEDCEHILKKAFSMSDFKLISWKSEVAFSKPNGFLGDYIRISINYTHANETLQKNFFMKRLGGSMQEFQTELAGSINAYGKETYVYGTIIARCEALGMDVTFAPRCYLTTCNTMVMEDLSLAGFRLPERKMLDYETMESLIIALSKYHAASVVFEEIRGKELCRKFSILDENPNIFNETVYNRKVPMCWDWFVSAKYTFLEMIDNLPMSSDNKETFRKILLTIENTVDEVKPHCTMRNTCNHGDLWCNNMMVRDIAGGKKECRLLDYQLLRYYLPMNDVMLALYTNTSTAFRKNHAVDLIKIYHANLSEILAKYGLDPVEIIPFRHIVDSCRLVSRIAKLQGSMARRIVFLPPDVQQKYQTNGDFLKDVMYDKKGKTFMDTCEGDEDYKAMIIEDLLDLYDVFSGKTIL